MIDGQNLVYMCIFQEKGVVISRRRQSLPPTVAPRRSVALQADLVGLLQRREYRGRYAWVLKEENVIYMILLQFSACAFRWAFRNCWKRFKDILRKAILYFTTIAVTGKVSPQVTHRCLGTDHRPAKFHNIRRENSSLTRSCALTDVGELEVRHVRWTHLELLVDSKMWRIGICPPIQPSTNRWRRGNCSLIKLTYGGVP